MADEAESGSAQDWSQSGSFTDHLVSGKIDDPAAEFLNSACREAGQEAPAALEANTDWSLE